MRIIQINTVLVLLVLLVSSCGTKKKTLEGRGSAKGTNESSHAATFKSRGNMMIYYGDLLGVNPKALNSKLYIYIDDWMGSPHRLGGTSQNGVDCSGFVGMLFASVYGKDLPRTSEDMSQSIKRKYENQLEEGDLVFFSFGGKKVDHVGIYLHNNQFVHVSTKQGVVISNLKDPWYYKYLSGCGSVK